MFIWFRRSLILGGIMVFLAGGFFWWGLQPRGEGKERIFVINRGESVSSISFRLEKAQLIKNRWVFLGYLYFKNQLSRIQAGSFRLSPQSSVPEIVAQLQQGRLDRWLTVLEGWRREEIAQELKQTFNLDPQSFLAASQGKEGYLFPDSYLIPVETKAEKVVEIMTNNFAQKWRSLAELASQRQLTQNQVVILASLVEREAKLEEDRPLVAGILIKRWRAGWPLQVDATVQFVKGKRSCQLEKNNCNWWPQVTRTDLRTIDSPYNTYLYSGLPPGPICNPSLSALKAVVNYQESDYWFYLSDARGKIHFARTLEEHQQNIKKYIDPT